MQEPQTRRESKRQSTEVRAARAAVLLDDPNVRAVFDEARQQCIKDIESTQLDGSPEHERIMLEHVRKLQALLEVKRIILRPLVQEALKTQQAAREKA